MTLGQNCAAWVKGSTCKTYIFKDYILRKIYVGRFSAIRLPMGEAGVDLEGADVALVGAICLVLSPSAAARRDLGI